MYDCIIIGAGAAGLTAGIYAGRARLSTLILEGCSVGGQIIFTEKVDNYPGFPEGIGSYELIQKMQRQAENSGVEIAYEEARQITVDEKTQEKTIFTPNKKFTSRTVIIATGAAPKKMDIPGEKEFTGRGVSYCAICDGPLYKGKDVVVIGGGDKAIEEALFLSRLANKVTVIHRRTTLRASKVLKEQAEKEKNINFILECLPEEIKGTDSVESVRIRNVKTQKTDIIPTSGVFIFVGIVPNTEFVRDFLTLDERGFIITDEAMNAGKAGIFACGDCRKKELYQLVTACGDGAQAGFSAVKYLDTLKVE